MRRLSSLSHLCSSVAAGSRILLRACPLLPFAGGLWLGHVLLPPQPWFLVGPLLLALVGKRVGEAARALGQAALGLLAAAAIGGLHRPVVCPTSNPTVGAIARIRSVAPGAGGRTSLVADLLAAGGEGHAEALRCRALLSAGRRRPEVVAGDTVLLPALSLTAPHHLLNPGVADGAQTLEESGVDRVGSVPDGAGIVAVAPHAPGLFTRWQRFWGRVRVGAGALIDDLPPDDARELTRAWALGQRAAWSTALREALRDSGLRHLLTLGLLFLWLWLSAAGAVAVRAFGRLERLSLAIPARRAAALACLPLPAVYAALSGDPTAARAGAIGLCFLCGRAMGRGRGKGLHLFSLGLIAAVGLWPDETADAPLLWSFAGLLGILVVGLPTARRLARPLRGRGWLGKLAEVAVTAAVVSAGAFAATAPLQAADGGIPVLGPLNTALALPLAIPACLLAQLGALGRVPLLLSLSRRLAGRLAALAIAVAPVSHWDVSRAELAHLWPGARPLRITFLSVGQGDAAVIETPGGRAIVIDGGGEPVGDFDPGERILVPFLRAEGIHRVDAVVLSHPHPDHANGLPAVLRSMPVGEVWQSREPCPLPACDELSALERTRGVRHVALGTGRFVRVVDGVSLELLYPRTPDGYDPALGPNDNSLVLRLRYGDFTALFTGDIEAEAERRLIQSGTQLAATVLKAPHHGSDTSSTAAFVAAVHPRAVVFSVGPDNRFGFPRADVVARYQTSGTKTFRTDYDGAVTVETDGRTATLRTAARAGETTLALP